VKAKIKFDLPPSAAKLLEVCAAYSSAVTKPGKCTTALKATLKLGKLGFNKVLDDPSKTVICTSATKKYSDMGSVVVCVWTSTARRLLATSDLTINANSDNDANTARAANVVIADVATAVATDTGETADATEDTPQQDTEYDVTIAATDATSISTTDAATVAAVTVTGASATVTVSTLSPTAAPTAAGETASPTTLTKEPTTKQPTTKVPTNVPTNLPTNLPTKFPTRIPTTKQPTRNPTKQPTSPTSAPTTAPTPAPTVSWMSRFMFWMWISNFMSGMATQIGF
jgi:hypothetical protein